jgi:hypothetical protein
MVLMARFFAEFGGNNVGSRGACVLQGLFEKMQVTKSEFWTYCYLGVIAFQKPIFI